MGGPPSKPKYYLVTDSGAVLWRKGEKNPGRGVKKNLKPCVYKHIESVNARYGTFCRTVRRVYVCSEVKHLRCGAAGKPSVKSANSCMYKTRNRVTYPWAGWSDGKTSWRTEPVIVEKISDDLWIGEKFQSNPEIAGSPRNSFRASLGKKDYCR